MNSKNGETYYSHELLLKITDKIDLLPSRQQGAVVTLQRHLSVRLSVVAGMSQMKHPTTS